MCLKQVLHNAPLPRAIAAQLKSTILRSAAQVGVVLPEVGALYADLYSDEANQWFYRTSFYVAPANDAGFALGKVISTAMNQNCKYSWESALAEKTTRAYDSIKCHAYIPVPR